MMKMSHTLIGLSGAGFTLAATAHHGFLLVGVIALVVGTAMAEDGR